MQPTCRKYPVYIGLHSDRRMLQLFLLTNFQNPQKEAQPGEDVDSTCGSVSEGFHFCSHQRGVSPDVTAESCVHVLCLTGGSDLIRAHWYLAVICFPGLEHPVFEKNPLCSSPVPEPSSEDSIPDHCCPLSPDQDRLASSENPSPRAQGTCADQTNGDVTKEDTMFPEGVQEPPCVVQAEMEPQYTSESLSSDAPHC